MATSHLHQIGLSGALGLNDPSLPPSYNPSSWFQDVLVFLHIPTAPSQSLALLLQPDLSTSSLIVKGKMGKYSKYRENRGRHHLNQVLEVNIINNGTK